MASPQRGRTLYVGTGLLNLARQLGRARANLDYLASFLMWPFAGAELRDEQTALAPVRRVLPGQLLALSAAGAQVVSQYNWDEPRLDLTGITPEEAGQRFREVFREAVRQRLGPGQAAAHLSGGMDSSAVVCLARDLLAQQGKRLSTLSLVYQMPSLARETEYIQMVLAQGGPVDAHFLGGDDLLDFDWFRAPLPEHDEPYGGLCQLGMERRLVDVASEAGARTLLTGGGAEVAVEGSRAWLADLLVQGRWIAAVREVRRWARATNRSLWAVLSQEGLTPLCPHWLRGGRARWPRVGLGTVPPWVRPDFARAHGLWARGRAALGEVYRYPYEQSANRFGIRCEAGEWSAWHLAGPRGIQTGRPFLDPRVLRFCNALPRDVRVVPGVVKPVLQSALRGILPEPIRVRRYKGNFNDVAWRGMARHLPQLEDMLDRSACRELEMFDAAELRTAIRQTAAGVGDMHASARINNTLALIAWYDQAQAALRRPVEQPFQAPRASPSSRRPHACART